MLCLPDTKLRSEATCLEGLEFCLKECLWISSGMGRFCAMPGALSVGINLTERSMKFRLCSLTIQKCKVGDSGVFLFIFLNRVICYF